MMGRSRATTHWLISAIVVCTFSIYAQAQISRPVDVVVLDVSVTANRQYVPGLTNENFRVLENGREQEIAFFHSGDAPVTVGLVIDSSQSMRMKRSEVATAALAFVASSNPQDEVFVTHFNDVIATGFPTGERFSSDHAKIRDALLAVKAVGRTSLYDALIESIKYLDAGRHERRALLVVSDGGDNQSRAGLDDVLNLAQRSSVTIYTVGIYDPRTRDRNRGALKKIANATGGEFHEPARLGLVHDVCQSIARDVRNRYTIGYYPKLTSADRGFRKVEVKVAAADRGKLNVRTRPGYYPRESQQTVNQP